MATITSAGVGSGLDVNSLVTQLVASERSAGQAKINRDGSRITTQISALGTLKGAMTGLQNALNSLKTTTAFQGRKATTGDATVFTATASATAASGSYAVEVQTLAAAHKLASNPFVDGAGATVGTGTLTLAVGSASFNVEVSASNNTLGGIRDAINAATDNKGVQATIVTASDGARLILTARNTGVSNALRVTTTGGDGGLSSLVYDPGTSTQLIEKTPASDALLSIEGYTVTSASNTVTNAIDGVTLNLLTAKPGTNLSLNVANDTSAAQDKVKSFVSSFNALAAAASQLRRYDATTRVAGPLLGDPLLRTVEGGVRLDLSNPVAAAPEGVNTLTAIGISTASDGTLKVDDAKLSAALARDFDGVARLMGSTDGIAARMYTRVSAYLASGAQLATRSENLQSSLRGLSTRQDELDARMKKIETRYRAQFGSLDSLLAGMQSTSSFISQQLTKK